MPLSRTVLFVFLALVTFSAQSDQQTLELATTSYEPVARQRIFDATVEAVNKSTVAAQVSDRITRINFDVDDYVEQGSVLLTFRDTQQRARLAQAEAALNEAAVRAKDADTELNRIRDIYKRKLVAKAALDKALATYKAARARVQQAEARVSEAKEQLEQTVVRAPYSGIVTERHVEVGETPRPGQPLMTGLSLNRLRVVSEVPQQFIGVLRDGCCPAHVLLPDARTIAATKLTVFPIADKQTHSFRIRVELDEGQHGLYPGMFVKLLLDVDEHKRLLVPGRALVRRGEVTAVYVLKDGKIDFRHVKLGRSHDDGRVEIHAGLEEGERVALDPVQAGILLKEQAGQ